MQSFDFQSSTRVVFGENALDQLGTLTKELGGRRVLVVTDPGIIRSGIVERAIDSLKVARLEAFVFDGVAENPTSRHVANGTQFAKDQEGIDLLIGLGGGSAMDCAKGINFILTNGGQMEDYWGVDKATKPMLPSIGIPTTAGTGSEAQSFASNLPRGDAPEDGVRRQKSTIPNGYSRSGFDRNHPEGGNSRHRY